jgi:hypothetical protein
MVLEFTIFLLSYYLFILFSPYVFTSIICDFRNMGVSSTVFIV